MTEDELLWESWKSCGALTEADKQVLSETQQWREELDRLEQRVSRSANRVSPVQAK